MIDAAPDEILLVPADELADPVGGEFVREAHAVRDFPVGRPRKRRRSGSIEHPALDLYAGYSFLLVRTALMRAEGWTPDARRPTVNNAWDAAALLEHLKWADQEHLVTISLDNRNQVNAIHEVSIGTATGTGQTAGNVLKVAFLTAAQGLIVAHNHPSGIVEPSQDDIIFTSNILNVGACVGVTLLDALVVGQDGWVSLRALAEASDEGWTAAGLARMAEYPNAVRGAARRHLERWPS